MRATRSVLSAVLGSALLLGPVALVRADDASERLEERVEKNLGQVDAFRHIDVDVDQGVVTLKGEVASAAEKTRAEKIARSAGARTIVNQIEVDADKAVARVKDQAEAKKDRIDERAKNDKEAVDRQAEVAKDRAERNLAPGNGAAAPVPTAHKDSAFDPLVTAKVKTKIIKDDLLDKSDINVDTDADGLVTLRGTVTSDAAKVRALELARTTEGVRKVVDRLSVKAPVVK